MLYWVLALIVNVTLTRPTYLNIVADHAWHDNGIL